MAKATKKELALMKACNIENPSDEDRKALESLLSKKEWIAEVNHFGQQVLNHALNKIKRSSYFEGKCNKRYLKRVRDDLGYESSSMTEKLIIDELVIDWVRLQYVQGLHGANLSTDHSHPTGNYWDKRLTMAHNRYMKSISTLAKVRKLIGATQVHAAKIYKQIGKDSKNLRNPK